MWRHANREPHTTANRPCARTRRPACSGPRSTSSAGSARGSEPARRSTRSSTAGAAPAPRPVPPARRRHPRRRRRRPRRVPVRRPGAGEGTTSRSATACPARPSGPSSTRSGPCFRTCGASTGRRSGGGYPPPRAPPPEGPHGDLLTSRVLVEEPEETSVDGTEATCSRRRRPRTGPRQVAGRGGRAPPKVHGRRRGRRAGPQGLRAHRGRGLGPRPESEKVAPPPDDRVRGGGAGSSTRRRSSGSGCSWSAA